MNHKLKSNGDLYDLNFKYSRRNMSANAKRAGKKRTSKMERVNARKAIWKGE